MTDKESDSQVLLRQVQGIFSVYSEQNAFGETEWPNYLRNSLGSTNSKVVVTPIELLPKI